MFLSGSYQSCPLNNGIVKPNDCRFWGNLLLRKHVNSSARNVSFPSAYAVSDVDKHRQEMEVEQDKDQNRFRWVEVARSMTQEQKRLMSRLPPKMMNRCKALIRQIICFSPEKGSLDDLLAAWVKIMKPRRADWLAVLKELKNLEHPLYIQVAEFALLEESFEANIRDYTKIIHYYGKLNQLQDAENTLSVMKQRGFFHDQVTLTAMIHMYSKAGNLKMAEETFEEIKMLGEPLDKRSYGAMIMAYVRAGMLEQGEVFLREMNAQEIYAGSEVYKALLRAYSMIGDAEGAQRVFEVLQVAGICPDVKLCALLLNAFQVVGQSQKAMIAFENMRKAGLEPDDKCVALVLSAYEKENNLNDALNFLIGLESDGIMTGKEASTILAGWFKRLGVLEEVELVLRNYAGREA